MEFSLCAFCFINDFPSLGRNSEVWEGLDTAPDRQSLARDDNIGPRAVARDLPAAEPVLPFREWNVQAGASSTLLAPAVQPNHLSELGLDRAMRFLHVSSQLQSNPCWTRPDVIKQVNWPLPAPERGLEPFGTGQSICNPREASPQNRVELALPTRCFRAHIKVSAEDMEA
ncbi:hypothetical protein KEM48_003755 [Puccinia striiformis f. sp. tritici PST-130]|nr:hypothetical protein KEM48_003755 [Puccinia striiformis f. sp. tritici PST-130]